MRIIITESQYNRLFLEQGKPDHIADIVYGIRDKNIKAMGGDPYNPIDIKNYNEMVWGPDINLSFLTELASGFNCWDKDVWEEKDFWNCMIENISIAVSFVPVLGTAASSILDFVNFVSYGVKGIGALTQGKWGEAGKYGLSSLFSGLGVIPGFTEINALKKLNKNVLKAGDNIIKEVHKTVGKNINQLPQEVWKKIIAKHSKNLKPKDAKELKKYFDTIRETSKKVKNYDEVLNKIIMSRGIDKKYFYQVIQTPRFIKLLEDNNYNFLNVIKKHFNSAGRFVKDFKYISKYEIPKSFNTIKWQGAAFLGLGITIQVATKIVSSIMSLFDKDEIEDEVLLEIIEKHGEQILENYMVIFGNEDCVGVDGNPILDCPSINAIKECYKKGLIFKKLLDDEGNVISDITKLDMCKTLKNGTLGQKTLEQYWEIFIKSIEKVEPGFYLELLKEEKEECLKNAESPYAKKVYNNNKKDTFNYNRYGDTMMY